MTDRRRAPRRRRRHARKRATRAAWAARVVELDPSAQRWWHRRETLKQRLKRLERAS